MNEESGIVEHLKKEHERLSREIRGVTAALSAFASAYGNGTISSKVSPESRTRMAAAQKARWAKVRNDGGRKKEGAALAPAKRTLSAAARKKIAAAQRARWARVKAAKKLH